MKTMTFVRYLVTWWYLATCYIKDLTCGKFFF